MASKKLSPEAQRRAAGRKPVIVNKPKGALSDPAEQKRFGISGAVNSSEMNRIKDAQKTRADTLASGGTYYSPYDTSLGNTEQSGYDAGKNDNITKPGGGGGRNVLNDFTRQLQGLLTGGKYTKPYDDLQSELETLYGTAQTDLTTDRTTQLDDLKTLYGDVGTGLKTRNTQGLADLETNYGAARGALSGLNTQAGKTINASMDSLQAMLQAQANPYAGLQAETVTPTAQLSSFLQGQNVGDQQTQDYAQVLNAQNAGSASAFNNLAGVMRSIAGANQQGALSDVAVQRDASTRQLAGSNLAYGNQLAQGLLADKLKMGQTYDQNVFDLSKGLLGEQSSVNQDYSKNKTSYNQGLLKDTAGISSDRTGQQNALIKQMLAAIAKGGVPKKGKLF